MQTAMKRTAVNFKGSYVSGPNAFQHLRAFPTAEFRSVLRANFDTLWSQEVVVREAPRKSTHD